MNALKTWEMLKELTEGFENGIKKRFVPRGWGWEKDNKYITISDNGGFISQDGESFELIAIGGDYWEEVPREATWQEAIEAWINTEQIEVWRDGSLVYRSNPVYKLGASEKTRSYHFDRKDFTEGKWYIL